MEHVHEWRDVEGFVPGTKQTCACGDYRYPTVEELSVAVPVSDEEASAPRSAQVVKISRGALITKRAVLQSQISTCKLDDPLDCPDHRDAVIELDGVNFLLGEEATDGQR